MLTTERYERAKYVRFSRMYRRVWKQYSSDSKPPTVSIHRQTELVNFPVSTHLLRDIFYLLGPVLILKQHLVILFLVNLEQVWGVGFWCNGGKHRSVGCAELFSVTSTCLVPNVFCHRLCEREWTHMRKQFLTAKRENFEVKMRQTTGTCECCKFTSLPPLVPLPLRFTRLTVTVIPRLADEDW